MQKSPIFFFIISLIRIYLQRQYGIEYTEYIF